MPAPSGRGHPGPEPRYALIEPVGRTIGLAAEQPHVGDRVSRSGEEVGPLARSLELFIKKVKGLQRLQKTGRIRMIRRGFYVIVPLEYATGGIVPPDWFIDDLMKFLQQPYYVGVLTAAALHGASHQQPQEYQVVVARPERAIRTANLNLRFFLKKSMAQAPVEKVKAYTGFVAVSSPAVTALDLVRFAPAIGGLDAVLTVLDELVEKIRPEDLRTAAQQESERSQVQRLGWLLERTKRRELAEGLAHWLLILGFQRAGGAGFDHLPGDHRVVLASAAARATGLPRRHGVAQVVPQTGHAVFRGH